MLACIDKVSTESIHRSFGCHVMLRLRKHIVAVGYVHIDLERPIRGLNLTPGQILSPFSSRFIASII